MKSNRPACITILCLARDASSRLPEGVGTRADICLLIKESQYIVNSVSDSQINSIVSGALDRLHYEKDPCVRYDSDRKLWIYLHRNRTLDYKGNFYPKSNKNIGWCNSNSKNSLEKNSLNPFKVMSLTSNPNVITIEKEILTNPGVKLLITTTQNCINIAAIKEEKEELSDLNVLTEFQITDNDLVQSNVTQEPEEMELEKEKDESEDLGSSNLENLSKEDGLNMEFETKKETEVDVQLNPETSFQSETFCAQNLEMQNPAVDENASNEESENGREFDINEQEADSQTNSKRTFSQSETKQDIDLEFNLLRNFP